MNGALLVPAALAVPGYRLVRRARPGGSPAEAWGLGALLGTGAGLAAIWAAGAVGLPLTAPVAFGALALAALGLTLLSRRLPAPSPAERPPAWTPAETALAVVIAAVVLAAAWRASFYPVSAMDAHSYDGRARWIVAERTLDLSVYRAYGITGSSNLAYPPLMPLALALGYWTGAAEGKPVDAIWFAALALVVYGGLRRRLPRSGALAGALFTVMIPELWLHASLALTNLPATAFLPAGVLVAVDAALARRRADAILAGALFAGAAGVRPDAIVPAAAVTAVAALAVFRTTRRVGPMLRTAATLLVPAVLLTIAWQIELKTMIGSTGGSVFRASPLPDPALVGRTARAFALLVPNPALTGWAPPLFALGLAAALLDRRPGPDRMVYALHAAFTIAILAALFVLYQQIDPSFGGGTGSYLVNSLKRALFYALPLGVAAGLTAPPIARAFRRFDTFQRSRGVPS